MVRIAVATSLALVLLAGCGTPFEQCLWRAEGDLRALVSERAERQRNLDRGFRVETRMQMVPAHRICGRDPEGRPIFCHGVVHEPFEITIPINRRVEARRIELLDQLIAEERVRAESARAACRAQFPAG